MREELNIFLGSEEFFVFIFSCIMLFVFLLRWYRPLIKAWPKEKNKTAKVILGWLPVFFAVSMYVFLSFFASFDVVDSYLYKIFYVVLGYSWIFTGLLLMSVCFGIIWNDDVLHLGNKAALPVIIGAFISLSAIYAGANTGDGPGWWCVLFAGAFGLVSWAVLGIILHLFTDIFERITIERNVGCGIRFGIYLVLCGAILGYACSGDWTSFSKTAEEFLIGWPVLPLTFVMILIELYYKNFGSRKGMV
ncbi:MAG: hypothetical protein FWD28_02290 [Treponema sp.]|nr:hypothetical protein [Treponema sp.]